MRDKNVRQAFQADPRYHRLNIQFDDGEPRLDDVQKIPDLKLRAQTDESVSEEIENIALCMVASLFYFELDSAPQVSDGKYLCTGHISCSIRSYEPAFRTLFNQLSENLTHFWVNGCPLVNTNDMSCFDSSGNFRKRIELHTDDRFYITLKQGSSKPYNISGSPFSVNKLVLLQGFLAVFGRPDHRKRKNSGHDENLKRKQRRVDFRRYLM